MEFRYQGSTYNTDNMKPFATGLESSPTIYVDKTGDCFLMRVQRPGAKPLIVHLHPSLLSQLIEGSQLTAVSAYLTSVGRPPELPPPSRPGRRARALAGDVA